MCNAYGSVFRIIHILQKGLKGRKQVSINDKKLNQWPCEVQNPPRQLVNPADGFPDEHYWARQLHRRVTSL